jgi:hypothetical protein
LAVIFQFCIPCETYIAPDESTGVLDPFKEETNCTVEKRGAAWIAFLHEGNFHSFIWLSELDDQPMTIATFLIIQKRQLILAMHYEIV